MTDLERSRETWTMALDLWAAAERASKAAEAQLDVLKKIEHDCKAVAHEAMCEWVKVTNMVDPS